MLLFGSSSHCAAVCCELRSAGTVCGAYSHGTTYMCMCSYLLNATGDIINVILLFRSRFDYIASYICS